MALTLICRKSVLLPEFDYTIHGKDKPFAVRYAQGELTSFADQRYSSNQAPLSSQTSLTLNLFGETIFNCVAIDARAPKYVINENKGRRANLVHELEVRVKGVITQSDKRQREDYRVNIDIEYFFDNGNLLLVIAKAEGRGNLEVSPFRGYFLIRETLNQLKKNDLTDDLLKNTIDGLAAIPPEEVIATLNKYIKR
jgi:hypothetical protein